MMAFCDITAFRPARLLSYFVSCLGIAMDLMRLLGGEFAWDGNPPSAQVEIDQLVGWFPIAPPTEYLDWLRKSDGGTAIRSVYPTYARIWSAEMVPKNNEGYQVQDWVPGFVGIGDDGGEVIVGFDTRSGPPYPVLAVPFMPMEFESSERLASDFAEFIGKLSRREGSQLTNG
jgi:hypothetical protein